MFGRDGRAVGAISVTTLRHRLPGREVERIGALVIDHADQISRALGGPAGKDAWPVLRPA